MLRFRIGPIPVEVHPSHFLVSALMGANASAASAAAFVLQLALWMFVVFVSVLVHELGHAAVALSFGYRPTVQLIWLGGVTRPNAPGPLPWLRNLGLTLAGPLAGLSLAAVCGLARSAVPAHSPGHAVLQSFFEANLAWAAINLMPVPPLDGGQAALALFRRFWGAGGEIAALALGAVTGLALAAIFGKLGVLPLALLFGLLGLQTANLAAAAFRNRRNPGVSQANRALTQARQLLHDGNLEEAQTRAEQVSLQEGMPLQRGDAHRLLGWVALKRGQGRLALDHFSQVQRMAVEPQALAAAFSLIGDEERALPLWARAYEASRDPTVLHEWAGALIRAGRLSEALSMRDVQPAAAFGCAERVLFLRGDYLGAARLGEEALVRAPTPGGAYDAACAYARAGRADDALRLLQRAIALGFQDVDFAHSDPDLSTLHPDPRWAGLWSARRDSAGS